MEAHRGDSLPRVRTHDVEGLLSNLACVRGLGDSGMLPYDVLSQSAGCILQHVSLMGTLAVALTDG
jgi:hypothetical protein